MRDSAARRSPRASVMVWSLTDAVLEHPEQRERELSDLLRAEFDGVAAFVRCSRYAWDDPLARTALREISRSCRRAGKECWIVPDPRLVSRLLIGEAGGLEVVMFGDAARATTVPNTAPVTNGRFSIRCQLPPRHVHMLTEVAVEFVPVALASVCAVRRTGAPKRKADVVNLTPTSRLFYNARDRYVEAFGEAPGLEGEEWQVVAFFRARTNHVDFSSPAQMKRYAELLAELARSGITPSGVLWDEPGFTCTYGTLPFSPSHRRAYRRETGRALETDLWKLAFEADDGTHIPARNAYYRILRESIVRAQVRADRRSRELWGPHTVVGMHDTWHFESADMCDMNHGSLDLWAGLRSKSAGFVDLGGVDALRDPAAPWYAHHAAMTVIAASLGRQSRQGEAYNNLWTVGDDDGAGWQREAMDYCVSTMGLFGVRWLAHAYGPVGTIGQERSFLGSPPLPGYPDHSTWKDFPDWNRRLREHLAAVEDRLPEANLLVLFPIETLYALADFRADGVAREVFGLILALLDAAFHPEVLSPALAARGRWTAQGFCLKNRCYEAVVYPHARVVPDAYHSLFRDAGARLVVTGDHPRRTAAGRLTRLPAFRLAPGTEEVLAVLGALPALRPVTSPPNAWATWTKTSTGVVVSVAPARCGYRVAGSLAFGGSKVELPASNVLRRVVFPQTR